MAATAATAVAAARASAPLLLLFEVPSARSAPRTGLRRPRTVLSSATRRTRTAARVCSASVQEDSRPTASTAAAASLAAALTPLFVDTAVAHAADVATEAAEGGINIGASYWTALGLFALSLPGLWSLIKRSTKSKVKRRVFQVDGPSMKPLKSLARDISTFFLSNNYRVAEAGETIVFEGNVAPSRGQAAFLTFCAFMGLGSTALVLSIAQPAIGSNAYYLTLFSPLAGGYYWQRASRKEQMRVKMITADDDSTTDVVVEGDEEEIERFRKTLQFMEKDKVYVKGILER
eukprot:jgi/Chlat1/1933/Chrsp153S02257